MKRNDKQFPVQIKGHQKNGTEVPVQSEGKERAFSMQVKQKSRNECRNCFPIEKDLEKGEMFLIQFFSLGNLEVI